MIYSRIAPHSQVASVKYPSLLRHLTKAFSASRKPKGLVKYVNVLEKGWVDCFGAPNCFDP